LQKHDVRKRGKFETYLYKLPSKIVSNPIRSQTDFQNFAWKTWKIVGDDTQNSPHDYEYICFISRFFVFKQNYRNLLDNWCLVVNMLLPYPLKSIGPVCNENRTSSSQK
jgi:hypothetical protein